MIDSDDLAEYRALLEGKDYSRRTRAQFNRNAPDADHDMKVQEGTPFERPATPHTPNAVDLPNGPKVKQEDDPKAHKVIAGVQNLAATVQNAASAAGAKTSARFDAMTPKQVREYAHAVASNTNVDLVEMTGILTRLQEHAMEFMAGGGHESAMNVAHGAAAAHATSAGMMLALAILETLAEIIQLAKEIREKRHEIHEVEPAKSRLGYMEVKAARRRARGYDPNARDADHDRLVQEGTPWARPATPHIDPTIAALAGIEAANAAGGGRRRKKPPERTPAQDLTRRYGGRGRGTEPPEWVNPLGHLDIGEDDEDLPYMPSLFSGWHPGQGGGHRNAPPPRPRESPTAEPYRDIPYRIDPDLPGYRSGVEYGHEDERKPVAKGGYTDKQKQAQADARRTVQFWFADHPGENLSTYYESHPYGANTGDDEYDEAFNDEVLAYDRDIGRAYRNHWGQDVGVGAMPKHPLAVMSAGDDQPVAPAGYHPYNRIIKGIYATFTPDGELQAVMFDPDPKVRARNEQIVRKQLAREKAAGHVSPTVDADYWRNILGSEAWQQYLAGKPKTLDDWELKDDHPYAGVSAKGMVWLDLIEEKRTRGRAIAYNPDAVDADHDMIVQEGTPYQRPYTPHAPRLPLTRMRAQRMTDAQLTNAITNGGDGLDMSDLRAEAARRGSGRVRVRDVGDRHRMTVRMPSGDAPVDPLAGLDRRQRRVGSGHKPRRSSREMDAIKARPLRDLDFNPGVNFDELADVMGFKGDAERDNFLYWLTEDGGDGAYWHMNDVAHHPTVGDILDPLMRAYKRSRDSADSRGAGYPFSDRFDPAPSRDRRNRMPNDDEPIVPALADWEMDRIKRLRIVKSDRKHLRGLDHYQPPKLYRHMFDGANLGGPFTSAAATRVEAAGLVESFKNEHGRTRWRLSDLGRRYLALFPDDEDRRVRSVGVDEMTETRHPQLDEDSIISAMGLHRPDTDDLTRDLAAQGFNGVEIDVMRDSMQSMTPPQRDAYVKSWAQSVRNQPNRMKRLDMPFLRQSDRDGRIAAGLDVPQVQPRTGRPAQFLDAGDDAMIDVTDPRFRAIANIIARRRALIAARNAEVSPRMANRERRRRFRRTRADLAAMTAAGAFASQGNDTDVGAQLDALMAGAAARARGEDDVNAPTVLGVAKRGKTPKAPAKPRTTVGTGPEVTVMRNYPKPDWVMRYRQGDVFRNVRIPDANRNDDYAAALAKAQKHTDLLPDGANITDDTGRVNSYTVAYYPGTQVAIPPREAIDITTPIPKNMSEVKQQVADLRAEFASLKSGRDYFPGGDSPAALDREMRLRAIGAGVDAIVRDDPVLMQLEADDNATFAAYENSTTRTNRQAWWDANAKKRRRYAELTRKALAQIRPMGPQGDKSKTDNINTGGDPELDAAVAKAVEYYPTDWLDTAHAWDIKMMVDTTMGPGTGGYFLPYAGGSKKGEIHLGEAKPATVAHEYGHVMERSRRALAQAEWTFIHRRSHGQPAGPDGQYQGDTYPDEWMDNYIGHSYEARGKIGYRSEAWEVFTRGMEWMSGWGKMMGSIRDPDGDLRAFMVGVLAVM